jgi:hypothetical protein
MVSLRFTEIAAPGGATDLRSLIGGCMDTGAYAVTPVALSHCQLRGVILNQRSFVSGLVVSLTNNVFEGGANFFEQGVNYYTFTPFTLTCYNNLFTRGSLTLSYRTNTTAWLLKDNLFDCASLSTMGSGMTVGFNGYRSGLTSLGGTSNLLNLNLDWQTGALGRLYYPTNGTNLSSLINAGSRTAASAGLYHGTTTTNQLKEAATTVDIGFHYLAVGADGQPLDTDGDGRADYLEDRNGNGAVDGGEASWTNYTSFGGLGGSPGLVVFTPLR